MQLHPRGVDFFRAHKDAFIGGRKRPWWWWVNPWLALSRTEVAYADAIEIIREMAQEADRVRQAGKETSVQRPDI